MLWLVLHCSSKDRWRRSTGLTICSFWYASRAKVKNTRTLYLGLGALVKPNTGGVRILYLRQQAVPSDNPLLYLRPFYIASPFFTIVLLCSISWFCGCKVLDLVDRPAHRSSSASGAFSFLCFPFLPTISLVGTSFSFSDDSALTYLSEP